MIVLANYNYLKKKFYEFNKADF